MIEYGLFELLRGRFRLSGRRSDPGQDGLDPVERLRLQHEQIAVDLGRVQGNVAAGARELRRGRRARRERRTSIRAIAAVEAKLVEHFQLEESSGYLADALRLAPRYHVRAEALRAQHGVLAGEMRAICELAEISGRSLEVWSELEWRLVAFSRRLKAHERAENEISSDAFLEDIGTLD